MNHEVKVMLHFEKLVLLPLDKAIAMAILWYINATIKIESMNHSTILLEVKFVTFFLVR